MFEELEQNLDRICRSITKNGDLAEDLKQEVYLVILKRDYEQMYEEGTLFAFAFGVAYRLYNFPKSSFYKKHRRYRFKECSELDQVTDEPSQEWHIEVDEILHGLDEMERIWVREWLRRNCSTSKLSRDAKISRPSIKERLEQIFKEIRCTGLN